MPQIIEANGREYEFPDGMSDDQIRAAIHQDLSRPDTRNISERATDRWGAIQSGEDLPPGYTNESMREKGFLEGVKDSLPTVAGLVNTVRHPIDTAKGMVMAQVNEASGAKDAYLRGDVGEGLRGSLRAALPVLGPMMGDINEDLGRGDMAYAGGKATGYAAQAAVPSLAGKGMGALKARAPQMIANAEAKYASTFGKGAKQAAKAQEMAPEMMDRGMRVTDKARLVEGTEDALGPASANIDTAINQMKTPIDAKRVQAKLDAAQTEAGKPYGPDSEAAMAGIGKYRDEVVPMNAVGDIATKTDVIPPQQARALRQQFDEKPYGTASTTADTQARKAVGDALREELNVDPAVAAANREFSILKDIKTIAEHMPESKTASRVLKEAAASAASAIVASHLPVAGPVAGAAAGLYALRKMLVELPRTPAWKTTTAIWKRDFALALQRKNYERAVKIGARITAGAGVADQP